MTFIRRTAIPFALAAGTTLLGCSVKAPPSSSWTIVGPIASRQAPSHEGFRGMNLGMVRFSAAPELRGTNLTWRSSNGLQLNQTDDRWVDYPDRMLEELVRLRLLRDGAFASVRSAPPLAGLDAVLHVRVLDFTEWHEAANADVRVALEWRMTRPGGEVLGQDVIRTSAPVTNRSVTGAVEAYREAANAAAESLGAAAAAALAER